MYFVFSSYLLSVASMILKNHRKCSYGLNKKYYDAIKLRLDFDTEYEGEEKQSRMDELTLIDDEKMVENMESNVHG